MRVQATTRTFTDIGGSRGAEGKPSRSRPSGVPGDLLAALSDERHGDPRKVTGSSQRSPLHAAGSGRCLHFGKCALMRGTEGSNPAPSSGESSANLRRIPSWLGIFAFGGSRGRVNGELSAQGTQFLKPCGGEPPSRIDRQPFSLADRVVHGVVITTRCERCQITHAMSGYNSRTRLIVKLKSTSRARVGSNRSLSIFVRYLINSINTLSSVKNSALSPSCGSPIDADAVDF